MFLGFFIFIFFKPFFPGLHNWAKDYLLEQGISTGRWHFFFFCSFRLPPMMSMYWRQKLGIFYVLYKILFTCLKKKRVIFVVCLTCITVLWSCCCLRLRSVTRDRSLSKSVAGRFPQAAGLPGCIAGSWRSRVGTRNSEFNRLPYTS